jgi:hypothetical protein
MPGGDWGFQKQVQDGTITSPACLRLPAAAVVERSELAENKRTASMMTAMVKHQLFWTDKAPEGRFEHWRFADGVSKNLYLRRHGGDLVMCIRSWAECKNIQRDFKATLLTFLQWHLGWIDARDFFRARSEGILPHGYDCRHEEAVTRSQEGAGESKAKQDRVPVSTAVDAQCPGGGDKIGALDLWILKRMREEKCADRDICEFGWEWEHGFRKGVQDFYAAVGV